MSSSVEASTAATRDRSAPPGAAQRIDQPVDQPVDLWRELDRLSRADGAMLAERWDQVRRSRNARRANARLAAAG